MSQQRQQLTENQIIEHYKDLKSQQQQIISRISEFESDVGEYGLVINAIQNLESNRKCFRMVGGVLVERTVGEVLPQIKQNRDGIKEVVKKLDENLQIKTKELNDFVALYKIKITSQ
ncbi:hypothetical protein ACTFIZ_004103 [Dictyostelium cf. discoideum]